MQSWSGAAPPKRCSLIACISSEPGKYLTTFLPAARRRRSLHSIHSIRKSRARGIWHDAGRDNRPTPEHRVARDGERSQNGREARCVLEDRRLSPDAPYLTQRVAHLAHRYTRARGIHDRGHEVRLAGGGALQLREGGVGGRGVALGPRRPHALDLLRLELGIDAQDLERLLVLLHVLVHADDDALALLDFGQI